MSDDTDRRRRIQSADDRALQARARALIKRPELELADTVPDDESDGTPAPEVPDEITGVHELIEQLDVAVYARRTYESEMARQDAQRRREENEAVLRVIWQHLHNERTRQSDRVLALAAAKVGEDVPERLETIERALRRLVGPDERNGRVGKLTEDVAALRDTAQHLRADIVLLQRPWWRRLWSALLVIVPLVGGVATGVVAWAGNALDELHAATRDIRDLAKETHYRLDRLESDVEDLNDGYRDLWRLRLSPAPRRDP